MREMRLNQGQIVKVDDADFDELSRFNWSVYWDARRGEFRVQRADRTGGKQKTIHMARQIMDAQPEQKVDHQNHDTLDMRRENLRVCSNAENLRNQKKQVRITSSQYKGVCWHKAHGKWGAQIYLGPHQARHLGYFKDECIAAKQYDDAARQYFGEFALCNFPEPTP